MTGYFLIVDGYAKSPAHTIIALSIAISRSYRYFVDSGFLLKLEQSNAVDAQ